MIVMCLQVKAGVVYSYTKAMGVGMVTAAIFSTVLLVGMQIAASIWLRLWSDDPVLQNVSEARAQADLRLGVYGALGFGQRNVICH